MRNTREAFTLVGRAILLIVVLFVAGARAQTTEFTYQGRLLDNSLPPTANYDFQFSLWNSLANGMQQGTTQTVTGVAVANGIFTVRLDFGAQFAGAARFIQIEVRPAGGGVYTLLAPRQPISSAPYAYKSVVSDTATTADTANTATNSLNLGGVEANQFVVTTDPRMSDARLPVAGSPNYIQNTISPQVTSNFNVSGVGRAGTLRSATIDSLGEYQMFGTRVLSVTGNNTSLGPNAGDSSSGTFNTYLGSGAGGAATSNVAQNTFAGTNSGASTTDGTRNSFFGARSGFSNDNGGSNTFVGEGSGVLSQNGGENSFFGADSGQSNSMGSRNSYFGVWAGGLPDVTDSAAIGYRAFATQNNSLILGSVNGFNGASVSPRIGIGTTAPAFKLHLIDESNSGLRVQTDSPGGTVASFGGFGSFGVDAPGITAGRFSILENGNVGVGVAAPAAKFQVNGNSVFSGTVNVSGTLTANGSSLTNINGANITNNTINASALASDTFPNQRNLQLLGSLRWDLLGQRIAVGTNPQGIAFDGANMWVTTNSSDGNVTKLRVLDGVVQGTFAVGNFPAGVAFDGANIWVTRNTFNNVTKLRASDGANLGVFAVGDTPIGVAFDGANIWVANRFSDNVTKLRVLDGANLGTFAVGSGPIGVAFDAANIWVVNVSSNNVTKLRASDGALQGTFAVGTNPSAVAFDGANIWVTNGDSNNVTKLPVFP
ncbi:MAG: hypothetical protein WBD16_08885 [Pyrinomonadaceae bacterium]